MTDPFAPDPFAEDVVITADTPIPGEKKVEKTPAPAQSGESGFTITLKGGSGYWVPWIVVRGATAEEAKQNLRDMIESELHRVTAAASGMFMEKVGESAPAKAAPAKPAAAPTAPLPAGWSPAPSGGGSGQTCRHGARTYKVGTSKAGKPYRAHFCPSPDRNDQCDPVWVQ